MSIPYDRLNHRHSMIKIKARLEKIMQPMALLEPSRSPACTTLSCSDDSARTNSSRELSSGRIKTTRSQENPLKIDRKFVFHEKYLSANQRATYNSQLQL